MPEFKPTNVFTVFVKDAKFKFRGIDRDISDNISRTFTFRTETVREGFKDLFELWDNIHNIELVNRDGDRVHIDLTKEKIGDI